MRGRAAVASVSPDDLAAAREGDVVELTRGQETELPQALKWQVARADEDYEAAQIEARRITVDMTRIGLTPKKHQSGETDITGGITKAGDGMVRSMLYEAARAMLTPTQSVSRLRAWGLRVARRLGRNRAIVAVARKLAAVLDRMWVDGTTFRFGKEDVRTA